MKYQPSLPQHNDNVSHNRPVRELLILLSGVLIIVLILYGILGIFVDVVVDHISPEQEAQLFANLDFDWEWGEEGDPEKQAYLQNLIDGLTPCLRLPYPITIRLVKSKLVNAMAVPGGNIVVFSGLLDALSSANGLTFILGHELGHFKNRDHLRLMGRGLFLTILATLVLGGNSDLTHLLTSTINLPTAKYSQSRERQADETALHALQCHFGHVGGATELFKALQNQESSFDWEFIHYFSSHPELQERIDDLHHLSQEHGYNSDLTQPFP